jgi:hypothetical protein
MGRVKQKGKSLKIDFQAFTFLFYKTTLVTITAAAVAAPITATTITAPITTATATTSASAATAKTSATSAASATAFFARASFVDGQRAAISFMTVKH